MRNYLRSLPEAQTPVMQGLLDLIERHAQRMEVVRFLAAFDEDSRGRLRVLTLESENYKEASRAAEARGDTFVHFDVEQNDLFDICRFASFTGKDMKDISSGMLSYRLPNNAETTFGLLEHRVPDWFPEVYGRWQREGEGWRFPLRYIDLLRCERMGWLRPEQEYLARELRSLLSRHTPANSEQYAALCREYPEILERDVWLLFVTKGGISRLFAGFFIDMFARGWLDRRRVLVECLNAMTRNLHKNDFSELPELFAELAPSQAELLALQEELAGALSAVQPKLVGAVAGYVKSICASPEFKPEVFWGALPVLCGTGNKKITGAALDIIATVARAGQIPPSEIFIAAAPAFNLADAAIQKKAARILLASTKRTAPSAMPDPRLVDELARWRDSMLADTRTMLAPLLSELEEESSTDTEKTAPSAFHPIPAPRLSPDNRLALPKDINELALLLSEAFTEPEPWHTSLVPEAIFQLRDKLDEQALVRLGPAMVAADKILWKSGITTGCNINMLAINFLYYCGSRLESAQGKTRGISSLKKKIPHFKQRIDQNAFKFDGRIFHAAVVAFGSLSYVVWASFEKILDNDVLPMLSAITHTPVWVDPLILTERLRLWQAADREPHMLDLQLALQRCAYENIDQAKEAARALHGEPRDLMEYFWGGEFPAEQEKILHPEWWVCASMMRPQRSVPQQLIDMGFSHIPAPYLQSRCEWDIEPFAGKNSFPGETEFVRTKDRRLVFRLPMHRRISRYLDLDSEYDYSGRPPARLFSEDFFLNPHGSLLHYDLELAPNNLEGILLGFLDGYGQDKSWQAILLFKILGGIRTVHGPVSDLCLSLGLLASSKEVRLHAAALWTTRVEERCLDGMDVGKTLAQLENHAWVPTKRFADLILDHLMHLGPEHDRQLERMLVGFLAEIADAPPVNIKKILELYREIVVRNASKVDTKLAEKLKTWEANRTYKTPAQALLRLS